MQHALTLIDAKQDLLPTSDDALEAAADLVSRYWQNNYRQIMSSTTSYGERVAMVENLDFLMDRMNQALVAKRGRE